MSPTHIDVDGAIQALDTRLRAEAGITPVAVPEGYVMDHRHRLIPVEQVPETDQVVDDLVRQIVAYGVDLSEQITRYYQHCLDDISAAQEIIHERYGAPTQGRGAKGNRTYTTVDGRYRVVVQMAERVSIGPEIQAARALIDQCIAEWAEGARAEVRAIIQHAFEPDQEGRLAVGEILRLRRIEIDDERWREAQRAIADALRPSGSRQYIRLYMRADPSLDWVPIPLSLAAVRRPAEARS